MTVSPNLGMPLMVGVSKSSSSSSAEKPTTGGLITICGGGLWSGTFVVDADMGGALWFDITEEGKGSGRESGIHDVDAEVAAEVPGWKDAGEPTGVEPRVVEAVVEAPLPRRFIPAKANADVPSLVRPFLIFEPMPLTAVCRSSLVISIRCSSLEASLNSLASSLHMFICVHG